MAVAIAAATAALMMRKFQNPPVEPSGCLGVDREAAVVFAVGLCPSAGPSKGRADHWRLKNSSEAHKTIDSILTKPEAEVAQRAQA